jgi:hypothetical protein
VVADAGIVARVVVAVAAAGQPGAAPVRASVEAGGVEPVLVRVEVADQVVGGAPDRVEVVPPVRDAEQVAGRVGDVGEPAAGRARVIGGGERAPARVCGLVGGGAGRAERLLRRQPERPGVNGVACTALAVTGVW